MPSILTSTVVDAPISKVWAIMRDFGALKSIYDNVDTVTLNPGSTGDQVGAVRTITLKSGMSVDERLVSLSDIDRAGTYVVTAEGTPFENVTGTYRLYEITDTNSTFVHWTTSFEVKSDVPLDGFRAFITNDVCGNCLDGLKRLAAS